MEEKRWVQRFGSYKRALGQFGKAVALYHERALSELERQGLIQTFEFTQELSWKVMKDYFVEQGNTDITGARDAFRAAFQVGLIDNGERWMNMIKSRNLSSHTYNEDVAEEIITQIIQFYYALLKDFETVMENKIKANN
ncbi:MAG: nucleotidyltransferase [Saprospiraceae bacterium]|nr:nucleotidyltransferase [Saprospiraceae bacterium]